MMDVVLIIISLAVGVGIGYLLFRSLLMNKINSEKATVLGKNSILQERNEKLDEDFRRTTTEKESLSNQNVVLNKEIIDIQQKAEILETKLVSLSEVKKEKENVEIRLQNVEQERNRLKEENTKLKKEEENRIKQYERRIEAANTLQESLEKEKERLNDQRVNEEKERFDRLKETWSKHEKDVENHIRLICKKNVIPYIESSDFPYGGKKPDNVIEILEQLIIFDAKSPSNDDLNNFPKYIKLQTESLKKYAKHDKVKNDLYLVIPTNTTDVIKEYIYNIGDYNVYIITKDSLEPIILSLKKIEDYEFADKLSPEDRDNICRIIGKFAHTTKRKIQIEQFFASEFLEILQKSKTLIPREMLESVIEFEKAEKLNPPMEKRRKNILTKDLVESKSQLQKEIEIREIPQIEATITLKQNDKEI